MNLPKPYTPEQEAFIRSNYEEMTHEQMAVALHISVSRVSYFCNLHNLRKKKPKSVFKNKYASKRPIPAPVKTGRYWPADHDNPSREDHINRILNMAI